MLLRTSSVSGSSDFFISTFLWLNKASLISQTYKHAMLLDLNICIISAVTLIDLSFTQNTFHCYSPSIKSEFGPGKYLQSQPCLKLPELPT